MAEAQTSEEEEPDWQCESCNTRYPGNIYRCKQCSRSKPYLPQPCFQPDSGKDGNQPESYSFNTRQEKEIQEQSYGGLPKKQTAESGTAQREETPTEEIIKDFPVEECRLVLLGKTGSGKSSTGNTITGREFFHVNEGFGSTTSKCYFYNATRFGVEIEIVDTPGFFDTMLDDATVTEEVARCVGMISPGPHALLLVIPIGRFTKEAVQTVDLISSLFGDEIIRYMIIIFSFGDNLRRDIEDLLPTGPPELLKLVKATDGRYVVFNNQETDKSRKDEQVRKLLLMVKKVLSNANNQHFTNKYLERCEMAAVHHTRILEERLSISTRSVSARQLMRASLTLQKSSMDMLHQVLDGQSQQSKDMVVLQRILLELQIEKDSAKQLLQDVAEKNVQLQKEQDAAKQQLAGMKKELQEEKDAAEQRLSVMTDQLQNEKDSSKMLMQGVAEEIERLQKSADEAKRLREDLVAELEKVKKKKRCTIL